MICARCEERRRPSKEDCDFCQECYDHIECSRRNIMARAVAARGYFDLTNSKNKERVNAFLHIFHPEMSRRHIHAVLKTVND